MQVHVGEIIEERGQEVSTQARRCHLGPCSEELLLDTVVDGFRVFARPLLPGPTQL
jgi:hypothetical protein